MLDTLCGNDQWSKDLSFLNVLEEHAYDTCLHEEWKGIKTAAKQNLAGWLAKNTGVVVNAESMFDVLAKRIHEYKRQHLKVLHVITLYERLKSNPNQDIVPRTFIFAGKSAPGYYMAKLIIKLINSVAEVINKDPQVNENLRVVFMPNFNVKNGQRLYPAADLSEQISMAGKEASGTGNMKFSMNGALTIGTLDGANIEIREEVGSDNFFLFGLTAEQAHQLQAEGYHPADIYHDNLELKSALDLINSGLFSHGDTELFRPLTDNLIFHDPFMVLADYEDYLHCQTNVDYVWNNQADWNRMSIVNVARIGKFSSDRSVRQYCDYIWKVNPILA